MHIGEWTTEPQIEHSLTHSLTHSHWVVCLELELLKTSFMAFQIRNLIFSPGHISDRPIPISTRPLCFICLLCLFHTHTDLGIALVLGQWTAVNRFLVIRLLAF